MEKLKLLANEPRLGAAEKQIVFRLVQKISSTIDINTAPHYNHVDWAINCIGVILQVGGKWESNC